MVSASTLRIAWRNLWRNRKRSMLAIGAIAIGQLAFLVTASLMRGYNDEFLKSVTGPMVGHIQVHVPGWREDQSIDLTIGELRSTLAEIGKDPQIEAAAPRIYAPTLAAVAEEGFMSMVVGIDASIESRPSGLLAGRDLSRLIGQHQVLVGSRLALQRGIEPGLEIAAFGQDIDGSIANDLFMVTEIISTPVEVVNSRGMVMSLEDAQHFLAMPDQAHEIVIHVKDVDHLDDTVSRLSLLPELAGFEVLPWQEVVPYAVAMMGVTEGFSYIILFVVLIAAAAGIANTMLMSTFERTHEFGMLLSLGCGPGRLSRMIMTEAVILGLLGVACGTVLGLGFVSLTAESGIDYAALGGRGGSYEVAFKGVQLSSLVYPKMGGVDVVAGVVAVFVTSLVSVVWPLVHIVRLEPMEAMRS